MEDPKRVLCPENEALAAYLIQKRQELAQQPKGISENLDLTLSKAYYGICSSTHHISSLKDLSLLKGVGKWILKLMQGFFDSSSGSLEPEGSSRKGKNAKVTKRYMPQKNSVAYALLITLYRSVTNDEEFMHKQDLIDAAEASGLSRVPIVPDKGKGKHAQFGSSPKDWYSGWTCMKTLITKGLVVKSSCPAKYMLTEEGKEAARECLIRSRLLDSGENLANARGPSDLDLQDSPHLDSLCPDLTQQTTASFVGLRQHKKPIDIPSESLERFIQMGFSKEQVMYAYSEVAEASQNKEISSLWPAVLCRLREDEVYGLRIEPDSFRNDPVGIPTMSKSPNDQVYPITCESLHMDTTKGRNQEKPKTSSVFSSHASSTLRPCLSSISPAEKSRPSILEATFSLLSWPPLSLGEKFEDVYEIILILDDREQFNGRRGKGMKLIENICKEHKIKIEFRHLPVGDGIWVARHKYVYSECVLDFIVERKNVDDLRCSIRDNRYKDQKTKLLRCGLKKLIYLVEGDPNTCDAAASIKTACFTTEILEGFDVQRTNSLVDTLRRYAHLTRSISEYYRMQLPNDQSKCDGVCPPYDEFVKRCKDVDKLTVSDVFAMQLMQVPQVTEEIALAVVDMFPTVISIAQAYALLDGDVGAQEEMLRKRSNNFIGAVASKNIFQLVWGNGH